MNNNPLLAGIDVGSTTVKVAVLEPNTKKLLFSKYQRHNANQASAVYSILTEVHESFPDKEISLAVCGSGGQGIAESLNAFFIQEVVANSIAVRTFYDDVRVAIELGGQDAKVIFFRKDEESGGLIVHDMRMNGSCAGGTGAFIDQVAELLHVNPEEFGKLAADGTEEYSISGRCGVFAKTDIQPLLNQGVSKQDIALSSFHAIAKQTIGGLAQGMDIKPKVIFEGGPLTFNPRLIKVFQERLNLSDDDIVIPENSEIIVAIGAALSIEVMFAEKEDRYNNGEHLEKVFIKEVTSILDKDAEKPFFRNTDELERYRFERRLPDFTSKEYEDGTILPVYIGMDAGSTTSKFILMSEDEELVDVFYANNQGDPLKIIKGALIEMRDKYRNMGVDLEVRGMGSTGYGEILFNKAFNGDYHTVETVAHAEAAKKYAPDVSFILDIGGQDMKAIYLNDGVVTGIVLNEACSAGCGSFIETYAKSLNVKVQDIADIAFQANEPSKLGSRCTVFMNSSIITEQKNGKATADILAGISRSIIENVFTKVIRLSNLDALGNCIVVQGGTFKNDAVLRSLEQYTGKKVVRPPFPGEMGAIGIALLTKKYVARQEKKTGKRFQSSFLGLDLLDDFGFKKMPGQVCNFCSNNCNRTIIEFNNGTRHITGNRCEKGEVFGDLSDKSVKDKLKAVNNKINAVPDMIKLQNRLLVMDYDVKQASDKKDITIGIPRTLEFWNSLPFWKSLFTSLGFKVAVSSPSSYKIFESGLQSIPSDTVCFPAKLVHGHVKELINKKVDRIFNPVLTRIPKENERAEDSCNCLVVQGYSMVVNDSDAPEEKHGIKYDNPIFHFDNNDMMDKQICEYISNTFDIDFKTTKYALKEAHACQTEYTTRIQERGREVMDSLKGKDDFAVVLAGRPYHNDMLINHGIADHFKKLGIPVLNLESIAGIHEQDFKHVRFDSLIAFHSRMYSAASYVAEQPNLELVQIVSFGCGHDAIISDEMARIMKEKANKQMLVLKLDEGENIGPLNIRIKSFVETVKSSRAARDNQAPELKEYKQPFEVKFKKEDKHRSVLVPNMSEAFARYSCKVLEAEGIKAIPTKLADKEAIALGKKYVHNDICYPAQVNIGECLKAIKDNNLKSSDVAIGLAKNCEACRAGHYAGLARKALDEAGYADVPILTTGKDTKDMHPGFKMGLRFQLNMLWCITMTDVLEEIRRKVRPYEINPGESDEVFRIYTDFIYNHITKNRKKAFRYFEKAIEAFNAVECDRSIRKPRVGIIGEILMNFHPEANANIERYLEANGMETALPTMHDFFRQSVIIKKEKGKRGHTPNPFLDFCLSGITDKVYGMAHEKINEYYKKFKYYEGYSDIYDLAENTEDMMDMTYRGGESWMMPGEVIELAKKGFNSFVYVQPFGCMPNHITGRGMIKTVKKKLPHIQIIALDYDPDTALANIENRLQMLIISAKEMEKKATKKKKPEAAAVGSRL